MPSCNGQLLVYKEIWKLTTYDLHNKVLRLDNKMDTYLLAMIVAYFDTLRTSGKHNQARFTPDICYNVGNWSNPSGYPFCDNKLFWILHFRDYGEIFRIDYVFFITSLAKQIFVYFADDEITHKRYHRIMGTQLLLEYCLKKRCK